MGVVIEKLYRRKSACREMGESTHHCKNLPGDIDGRSDTYLLLYLRGEAWAGKFADK